MIKTARLIFSEGRISILMLSLIPISLFMKPGFLTASVVIFFVYAVFSRSGMPDVRRHWILLLPILLFLIYVIWLIPSSNSKESLNLLIRRLPLLIVPVSFLFLSDESLSKNRHTVLFVYLLACIVASFLCFGYAVYNIIHHDTIIYPGNDQKISYYFAYRGLTSALGIDPIYLSLFVNLAFVISLGTPFLNKKLRIVFAVYLFIFTIFIASKIGIIALVLTLGGYFFVQSKSKKMFLLWLGGLAIVVSVAIYALPFLKDRFITSTDFNFSERNGRRWNSNTFRLAIWLCDVEAIEKNPIWGYGTGEGQNALENVYREKDFYWGQKGHHNPHSEFFSIYLDSGIIGLVVLLLMLFAMTYKVLQTTNFLQISFLIMIFLWFLIECVFLRQKGIIFFAFFYSLFFVTENRPKAF